VKSLLAVGARRALSLAAVVVIAPSITYLISATLRDGRSAAGAAGGLVDYLRATFLHFDLGIVNVNGIDMPVRKVLVEGLPVDVGLVVGGLVLGTIVGMGAALLCGPLHDTRRDHAMGVVAALGLSMPVYLLAYMALFWFGRIQGSHPLPFVADTDDYAQPWVHPLVYLRAIGTASAVIAVPVAAACFRMARVAMHETRELPHLMTARGKGVGERLVLWRHALPTAAPPVVTLIGVSIPWLVFNAILVEVPYNLPGGFRMAHFGFHLDEDHSHLPQVAALQGVVLEAAAIIAVAMLVCDVLGAWLDPRLRT
jgi:ABC-type dipeptide/oligopeptide/nickel transport system permease component